MNRELLKEYILDNYNATSDFPWIKYPSYEVFRHINKKWFAVIMEIPKTKLGLKEQGNIQVVNLKCSIYDVGKMSDNSGIYPAYHMNKERWITVALDGSVNEERLKMFVDISYQATLPWIKVPKGNIK